MAHPRVRQASPPRILLDPTRSSTGTILSSTYDTRYAQPPRASISSASSARDSVTATRNSIQPVSKRTYVDQAHPGAKISSTTYAVRPRRDSDTSTTRRPSTIVTKSISPTRGRGDYVDSPRELVAYRPTSREEPIKYLQPAARLSVGGYPQRHNSVTRTELDRYTPSEPPGQRPKEYHRRGPYVEKVYTNARPNPPVRYNEDEGYSYTTPKEQFARDFAPRPRRESLTRRDRPSSAVETEFKQLPFRRDAAPPPSSARHFDRIETADARGSRTGFDSDTDRPREVVRSKPATRAAVVHQRDDGYSSSRDDYESRRPPNTRDNRQDEQASIVVRDRRNSDREYDRRPERVYHRDHDRDRYASNEKDRERVVDNQKERHNDRYAERPRERERNRESNQDRPRESDRPVRDTDGRRQPRSRDASPEGSGVKGLATAAGLGGLAAVGLRKAAGREGKDAESDDENKRHRRHRRRRSRDQRDFEHDDVRHYDNLESRDNERHHRRRPTEESSGSDTPDEEHSRRRPASRTRERRETRETNGQRGKEETESIENEHNDRNQAPLPAEDTRDLANTTTEQGPNRSERNSPTSYEGRTLSPGEGEDGRPRRVQLVEPVKKDEVKPRGILKPPREIPFPEDPNPQREGVAPLKSAGHGGIPPNARWTKISRMLVNPEALERAQERFEERDDYVIVLRVLKREEIEKFAEKTREIREARERAWQEQLDERRRRKAERQAKDDAATDEDDLDDDQPQLALEAPPPHPPADLRNLQTQNNSEPRMEGVLPVPAIDFDTSNYSTNV